MKYKKEIRRTFTSMVIATVYDESGLSHGTEYFNITPFTWTDEGVLKNANKWADKLIVTLEKYEHYPPTKQ